MSMDCWKRNRSGELVRVPDGITIRNIDYHLLREQLHCLLRITEPPTVLSEDDVEYVNGVINLLDYLLDQAVDSGLIDLSGVVATSAPPPGETRSAVPNGGD